MSGQVTAVLGPTNTGKTHYAVERMLGHATGMIGLPLRLLAREIYDRIVEQRGPACVALITGEERIVPRSAQYFVCTVEAMPLARRTAFLAVDEIQLAADAERGHVFTERLLHARGTQETLFMGADTMRPLLKKLLPEVRFLTRERFSTLTYAGLRKVSRLPRRAAVVAFSAADVYALAELMRRQRGGAAVVLGALSPRTRNAQVAMYQSGEVDYLVATDAIGMGLNMDVDHVAFAGLRKFDGRVLRDLQPAEIGQIAGRAGRHMNHGTFGITAGRGELDAAVVDAIEHHRFDPVQHLQWRSRELRFGSIGALIASLRQFPPRRELARGRDADDVRALRSLGLASDIQDMAKAPAAVRLLWEVCQIPDFRKSLGEAHHLFLARVYRHLMSDEAVLPTDWVAGHVGRLDRTDGDIDTLSTRIAHVRTWTYISHRANWLDDAKHWQERARALEDKLSDALHEALTQRFVDRRTAALMRGLRDKETLIAAVDQDGEVLVEGQYVGRLKGLSFAHDREGGDRAVATAANRVLGAELERRAGQLGQAGDEAIAWRPDNQLWWQGAAVARLQRATDILRPQVTLLPTEHINGRTREAVRRRLSRFVEAVVERDLQPLLRLLETELSGAGRGLAYQLAEHLGVAARDRLHVSVDGLTRADRAACKRAGLRLGYADLFLPALLKARPAATVARLRAVWEDWAEVPPPPPDGRVSFPIEADADRAALDAYGYRVVGKRAIRVDMLDRLAGVAQRAAKAGPFTPGHEMLSLVGCGQDEMRVLLRHLGYRAQTKDEVTTYRFAGRARPAARRPQPPRRPPAHSPFAALADLQVKQRRRRGS
ncbi:MAG: helicase-related protein [Alphaproteobacteria bacterium]